MGADSNHSSARRCAELLSGLKAEGSRMRPVDSMHQFHEAISCVARMHARCHVVPSTLLMSLQCLSCLILRLTFDGAAAINPCALHPIHVLLPISHTIESHVPTTCCSRSSLSLSLCLHSLVLLFVILDHPELLARSGVSLL